MLCCSWHLDSPPPFAFVTPDQQVQPFGKSLEPRHARARSLNLRVDDIPGATPKTHCFATSPRLTNPLEPNYHLPRSNHVQPAQPVQRFIKNAIDNSDIPGAQVDAQALFLAFLFVGQLHRQSCPRFIVVQAALCKPRQHVHNFRLDCSDVEGAAPGWQPDWKIAAKARHALHRPATAPALRHIERPTR